MDKKPEKEKDPYPQYQSGEFIEEEGIYKE